MYIVTWQEGLRSKGSLKGLMRESWYNSRCRSLRFNIKILHCPRSGEDTLPGKRELRLLINNEFLKPILLYSLFYFTNFQIVLFQRTFYRFRRRSIARDYVSAIKAFFYLNKIETNGLNQSRSEMIHVSCVMRDPLFNQ